MTAPHLADPAGTSEDASEELIVQEHGRVLVLVMNRPHVRNAMSKALAERIAAALDDLDRRPDLGAAVLTGSGGTFCAGMDLKGFLRGELPVVPGRGLAGFVRRPPAKPLVAAVEGYALAGGFEMVLACDLVVASREARFGLPEVKRGLTANGGGLFRLPRQIPSHLAAELILTGRMWAAAEAASAGLVNRLAEPGEALATAIDLATEVAANAPLALIASKRVMAESAGWDPAEAFDRQESIVDPIRRSADAREGATAFAEKRSPRWSGQ